MLVIRFTGWSVKLDHQVGSAGKHGIWSFHGSESSYVPDMQTILRHAAIRWGALPTLHQLAYRSRML